MNISQIEATVKSSLFLCFLRNHINSIASYGQNTLIMTTFLIVLGALLVANFLLLQFSCNDATEETPEEE